MIKLLQVISIFFLTIFCSGQLFSQQLPVASGGNATGSGGSASYSVGQVLYTVNTGSEGYIIQGVQQPYEISVVLGNDVVDVDLELAVYPNPTVNYLMLKVGALKKDASYNIVDINGHPLRSGKVNTQLSDIILEDFHPGTYMLNYLIAGKIIKTFKFIKN